jgi:two-component system cell cycle sensor histidine kinase/response regulator CckA
MAAVGVAVYALLALRKREATIRRQLAREASLKARFDEVFERASDIMVVHDRRGRLSTINRAGEQVLGYSREEVRMLEPNWIFGNDYIDVINRMITEGADSQPQSFRSALARRRGVRVPVDVHARVLVGDGQVVGVMAIARDLSEHERLETELRQAQKMEAVGRLASGIAHDFNNLITVLIGYSDELLEHVPENSEARYLAESVRRATDRAATLTQQLLAFSRRQATVANSIDLNRLITSMDDMLRRLLGSQIKIQLSLATSLATISADESQISQVIMNLAVNARDAMPDGGVVQIRTANIANGAEGGGEAALVSPMVALSVIDDGVGMDEATRAHIFEPFFSTKKVGQGKGLGLSTAYGIVGQSGGDILVNTAPGKGSAFTILLPRATNESDPGRYERPDRVGRTAVPGIRS